LQKRTPDWPNVGLLGNLGRRMNDAVFLLFFERKVLKR